MFLCILGRQPEISIAELEAVFGKSNVEQQSDNLALVISPSFDLSILGGITKYGEVVANFEKKQPYKKSTFIDVSRKIVQHYNQKWKDIDHKITLGISAYGFDVSPRDVQKTGLLIKSQLKKHDVSLRLIPNTETTLSTATSHNNKLGLSESKVELLIANTTRGIIVAESGGSQNITAYAKRDQQRPRRDAFVGMLPPKLAQIMINLAIRDSGTSKKTTVLDPFCGTGTVLQESLLRGFDAVGSDLSEKMVDYTSDNLDWLLKTHKQATGKVLSVVAADAMTHQWPEAKDINAVVCETYLGQPFSAPPSSEKLKEVVRNCDHIISSFLANIKKQLQPNTTLCIAVPAWRGNDGRLTHLPLTRKINQLGYEAIPDTPQNLIYHREDQVVARQLLILKIKDN